MNVFEIDGLIKTDIFKQSVLSNANALRDEVFGVKPRSVHVGDFGESWLEYDIQDSGLIADTLASEVIHTWAQSVSNQGLQLRPSIWANTYTPGQHISWHRDKYGAVQILLSICQPPPECGGVFQIRRYGIESDVALYPGDALLFRAVDIEHKITPLNATRSNSDPMRISIVARYFSS
ncbi:hypothetical protein [Sphingomonas bacterium]|uniref:hypothetical protein n=1 Tax=Sphingomonas bacterium TaxID=1895847 RepID=UPI001C2CC9F8|nr:hypothetical protein [Sphingomonas bacterium]